MDTPTGIHFDPDGTVRIVTDTQAIRLRRPTLAEYSDLVDAALDVDYSVIATRGRLVELSQLVTAGEATTDDVSEAKRINRFVQTAKASVVETAIALLGDSDKVDTLPPWAAFGAGEVLSKLFAQWEHVPFHGSGQSGT